MATMTVSLPDTMKEWIEAQVQKGNYASASDYVRDLVRRDKTQHGNTPEFTLEDLRHLIAESRASGVSQSSLDDIFTKAERIASMSGAIRD
jgi:antitoxin ParD1/3/4